MEIPLAGVAKPAGVVTVMVVCPGACGWNVIVPVALPLVIIAGVPTSVATPVALLNDTVRSIPGVRSTETFTYLRLYKQTYAWGTR